MTDQPQVATCSWTAFTRDMGIPVRISRSAPRWISLPNPRYTDLASWPRIMELAPSLTYFREPDKDRWEEQFLSQLAFNAASIRQKITWVNQELGGRAVLLCFEKNLADPEQWCHRTMAARFMKSRFGWDVPELGGNR